MLLITIKYCHFKFKCEKELNSEKYLRKCFMNSHFEKVKTYVIFKKGNKYKTKI